MSHRLRNFRIATVGLLFVGGAVFASCAKGAGVTDCGDLTWYADKDGDGFGSSIDSIKACDPPEGYLSDVGDCNDNDAFVYPGAPEECDTGIDNNCDGQVGDGDNDGDGFVACKDCDDTNDQVNSGAAEVCDGVDNDCDGLVDLDQLPADQLCDTGPGKTTVECVEGIGCVFSCEGGYYDVNGDEADGCECLAKPWPLEAGQDCASAIDVGNLTDAMASIATVEGNMPVAGREIWYVFSAIDDLDTAGDEFHVDVRFDSATSASFELAVYRNGCPGTGEEIAVGEPDVVDWFTDQNYTTTGCTTTSPCGEGNCSDMPSDTSVLCEDDSATFHVRVTRTDAAASCENYTLTMSNGYY